MKSLLSRVSHRITNTEVSIVKAFKSYSTPLTAGIFALIFIWFGLTKLAPGVRTPVYYPVHIFFEAYHVPELVNALGLAYHHKTAMMLIGVFEVIIGILFLTRSYRILVPLVLFHQVMTFLSLTAALHLFFEPPFIRVAGYAVPWMVDEYSSYVIKNLFILAAFFHLLVVDFLPGQTTGQDSVSE